MAGQVGSNTGCKKFKNTEPFVVIEEKPEGAEY
jgi:hypothetical protein